MPPINPVPVLPEKKKAGGRKINRQKKNYLIYLLFSRRELEDCLAVIEQIFREFGDFHEFANLIKALVLRMKGSIHQSLEILKKCHFWNEANVEFHKQIAKNLLMMGKIKASIEVTNESLKLAPKDWEVHYTKGMCYFNLKDYETAMESFQTANSISRHELTFLQLGRTFEHLGSYQKAIDVYNEGLKFSIENHDLLLSLGILLLKLGDVANAGLKLGKAIEISPKNFRGLLAIGSLIQGKGDVDAALTKYRDAAASNVNNAQLWNNIGMCFYGLGKLVAAISCLKKAQYLDPFEWMISFNLGLVHFATGQFVSAYHYFSMTVTLNPRYAAGFMYLGLTLNRLDDFKNACAALDRALEIETSYLILLNYSVLLTMRQQNLDQAKKLFQDSERIYGENNMSANTTDLAHQRNLLGEYYGVQLRSK